jgi:hypothetical protein
VAEAGAYQKTEDVEGKLLQAVKPACLFERTYAAGRLQKELLPKINTVGESSDPAHPR